MSKHTSARYTEMPGQTQVIRAVLAPAGSSQLQRSAPQACKHRIYLLTGSQIETCLLPLSCKIANSKHCNLPQALNITTGYLTCMEQITSKLKPLSLPLLDPSFPKKSPLNLHLQPHWYRWKHFMCWSQRVLRCFAHWRLPLQHWAPGQDLYVPSAPTQLRKKKSHFRRFAHFFLLDKTLGNTSHKQHHTYFAWVQLPANQGPSTQVRTTRLRPWITFHNEYYLG